MPAPRSSLAIAILCHASRGGSTKLALDLANALAERGHDVHVFTLRPLAMRTWRRSRVKLHFATSLPEAPIDTSRLHTMWSTAERRRFLECLMRLHERVRFDVVHFHYALPFAEFTRILGHPTARAPRVIGTLHGTDITHFGLGSVDIGALTESLAAADTLTTVSAAYARLATQRFGLASLPEIIPNFVDCELFQPRMHVGIGGHRQALRLIHVSNFRPVKNVLDVIRIFGAVQRTRAAELWLVGEGEQHALALAHARAIGLHASVHLLGFREDLHRLVSAADVLISTSHQESFCLAALEAMASGVPVVASRVGGLCELVRDGETGHLYEPGDTDGAAAAILALEDDPARRLRMGKAARRRALEFDRDTIVSRYEALYQRVLSAGPRVTQEYVRAATT